jgi:16S rRNA (guanine527-N7)-methyltransferase
MASAAASREVLGQFFPELSAPQLDQLEALEAVFREWNDRINLVSRKDMEAFVLHHLVHSLALTKWVAFPEQARVLDVGTGGGLPGLPLAILFPKVRFFLCDSVQKKGKAVAAMATELGLDNVEVVTKRAEQLESKWDFILGRAVTRLPRFLSWIQNNLKAGGPDGQPNGVIYWKGSLYAEELEEVELIPFAVHDLGTALPDPYFQEKFIIHLTTSSVRKASLPEVD